MWKSTFLCLAGILGLVACQEITEIDLPQEEPRLVVEGELTNTEGPHYVRLTLTQSYFDKGPEPVVTNAEVWVTDSQNNRFDYTYSEDGFYLSNNLTGETGENYNLHFIYDGNEYRSSGVLNASPILDSLDVKYFPERGGGVLEEGYYLRFYGRIPKETPKYFRIKVYENDSLYNDRTDLIVPDAQFVPSRLDSIELGYQFVQDDEVRVELYVLNQDMYDYYVELRSLLFNDGGLFSPPPRNPTSNISNISQPNKPPLGYFQVSSFDSETILVDEAKAK